MKILVLNCGSSSIKYKLFEDEKSLFSGRMEKIGEKDSKIKSYKQGIELMIAQLLASKKIKSFSDINAIGHRVVHGGEISKSSIINKDIINSIKRFSSLAPLHDPANLNGILQMQKIFPKIPHVAVFDTSFHQTMPEKAFVYALPYEFYKKYGIRRYGFHGISHQFVSQRASEILKMPLNKLNMIICHLGAGCSISAIKNGKVIDTSMGFTPLEGLVMGTRAGDIDPGILIFVSDKLKMKPAQINDLLNKKSGLAGLSGISGDMREVLKGYKKGNKRCKLALEIFCYRIRKYIGSYASALGNVDALVFTAAIGENVPLVRSWSADIACLGINIDNKKNGNAIAKEAIISTDNSKVKLLVIPTDEERLIASDTLKLIK